MSIGALLLLTDFIHAWGTCKGGGDSEEDGLRPRINSGVHSKNKSSCTNTLLSYEPFSVFQVIEGENRIFSLIANGLYLNMKISVKLVFE